MSDNLSSRRDGEWLTQLLISLCTLCIMVITRFSADLPLLLSVIVLGTLLALHSSLQHEVLHGHPWRNRKLNELLVFIPFGCFVPYRRFRDTHLQHHVNERLTDPYDDPECNYVDPEVWYGLSVFFQSVLLANNTLAGRMLIGPVISLYYFYRDDLKAMLHGDTTVVESWLLHLIGLAPWLLWLSTFGTMPVWAYALAAYTALSLLKVRTFLEHRAHKSVHARTAIVESRGFLSWLFLNNNFHFVHHMHPNVAWYCLPELYNRHRDEFLRRNNAYVFSNYRCIFALYLFRRKDAVAHPEWPMHKSE